MNSADEILKNAADSFAAITKISDDVEKAAQMITEALRPVSYTHLTLPTTPYV